MCVCVCVLRVLCVRCSIRASFSHSLHLFLPSLMRTCACFHDHTLQKALVEQRDAEEEEEVVVVPKKRSKISKSKAKSVSALSERAPQRKQLKATLKTPEAKRTPPQIKPKSTSTVRVQRRPDTPMPPRSGSTLGRATKRSATPHRPKRVRA
jgi:hypothetical protein